MTLRLNSTRGSGRGLPAGGISGRGLSPGELSPGEGLSPVTVTVSPAPRNVAATQRAHSVPLRTNVLGPVRVTDEDADNCDI